MTFYCIAVVWAQPVPDDHASCTYFAKNVFAEGFSKTVKLGLFMINGIKDSTFYGLRTRKGVARHKDADFSVLHYCIIS